MLSAHPHVSLREAWWLIGWAALRPWACSFCLCETSEHVKQKALNVFFRVLSGASPGAGSPRTTAPLQLKLGHPNQGGQDPPVWFPGLSAASALPSRLRPKFPLGEGTA